MTEKAVALEGISIAKCGSCGQEMRPTDYLERLREELALAKAEAKVFREAFDHITMHMKPDEAKQYVYMPYNEFFDHASVDDARYWGAP